MFESRSTVMREKIGGLSGHALETGNIIPYQEFAQVVSHQLSLDYNDRPDYVRSNNSENNVLRVILGYQHKSFSDLQKARFFNNEFNISDKCDRMGFRLNGPEISSSISSMLSEGICYGAIQIPADGQPIVLLNDRQTIGGYPKMGSLFSLDIPKLTQRLPGSSIRFEAITIDEAQHQLHLAKYRYENTVLRELTQ